MADAMMGEHEEQKDLFSYGVDLDRRVRADNPLRLVKQQIDFTWVREEVAGFYGANGNVSVDPVIILKLVFLLFYDDVKSERELMRIVPERLDYLWFLGLGLDDEIPDHSVLSKARARWGQPVFEKFFVRTIQASIEAGLVDGGKVHLDGSLVDADASRDSVVRSSPELIAALKRAYRVQEEKLGGNLGDPHYRPVNASLCSTTDPDAPCVRQNKKGAQGDSRPRYKNHRAVDDRCGVITAVKTTPGDIAEPTQTEALLDAHEQHTGVRVATAVGDQQYGTADNHRRLQQRGVRTHLKTVTGRSRADQERFGQEHFSYEAEQDRYRCPADQWLHRRYLNPRRQTVEYRTLKGVCAACALREQCTVSAHGRVIVRHVEHELIEKARAQAHSPQARQDYRRRRHLAEGSFAQAANQHHFKRARWRRLWRQQIQDHIIAAIQNIKILLKTAPKTAPLATQSSSRCILSFIQTELRRLWRLARHNALFHSVDPVGCSN